MDRATFEHLLIRRTSRRRLLKSGAALALAASLPGHPTRRAGALQATPIANPTFATNPFAIGVASGDPLPDSVVLWTRLVSDPANGGVLEFGPIDVRWELASDESFGQVVQSGTVTAVPELAHSVHADAVGLEPGRQYFYRFMAGAEVSPVGRTKTAPAAGAAVDRLRFAFASCQHWEDGWYTAYARMVEDDLDLVAHLGDYIYEYGPAPADDEAAVRRHNGPEIVTLDDYRKRYALYKSDPNLQAAHAAFPWIVTWDDHDVENGYADDRDENGSPPEVFLERRAAAYQTYYEHMPLGIASMPLGPAMQLYRRLDWGDLARFAVLDTRQYRSQHPCGDGAQVRCPAALDPSTTMLGPEQEQWLLAGFDASPARWNVIAQSLQMAELEQQPGAGELYWNDSWPGYPAARARILSHLMTRNVSNPVVLSGDIHCSWVCDLKADFRDPESATIATELIGTSISSEGDSPSDFFKLFLPENPHIKYFDGRHGGYVSCTVTPDGWQSDIKLLASLTTPDAALETVASFAIESGQAGAKPV